MDVMNAVSSLLAVATASIESTRALKAAIKRYQTRDATLFRLLTEVEDTENTLMALEQLLQSSQENPELAGDASIAELLRGPINRCSQLCQEFQAAMTRFSAKSKMGIVDWARMEFLRGDFNQFMDTLAGYKATISVGLGVLTMHIAKLSKNALEELEEMVKNTMYSLGLQLQRINDRMQHWPPANSSNVESSTPDIDLSNERQVTEQCLQICEDARLYLEAATERSNLAKEPVVGSSAILQQAFEAQILTRKVLNENHTGMVKLISELRQRLEQVVKDGDSSERTKLEADISTSKQCLELCKLASSEVSNQKIHIIGEVIAEGDSDHVVVTTLADIFNVGRTTSKNRSALLVGSMSDETLVKLSSDRYSSRFGTATTIDRLSHDQSAVNTVNTSSSRSPLMQKVPKSQPSPNETRRRGSPPSSNTKKYEEN